MQVTVDRDGVTMGDDMESHEHRVEVPGETTLGAFLAHLRPEVAFEGGGSGTWVVRLGGRRGDWVGMYADDEMRVLREADRTLTQLRLESVYFEYWAGAPTELLLESLVAGRLPDRSALQQEGQRRQQAQEEARARAEEATTTKRLLSPEAVDAIGELGGRIEVHAPSYAQVVGADGVRHVLRVNRFWSSIGLIDADSEQQALASFRPPGPPLVETTLVARLGLAWRETQGLPPVEPPAHRLEVRRTGGIWMWTWTDRGVPHEGRYWPDGSLAAVFAPYARLGVPQITALFTARTDR